MLQWIMLPRALCGWVFSLNMKIKGNMRLKNPCHMSVGLTNLRVYKPGTREECFSNMSIYREIDGSGESVYNLVATQSRGHSRLQLCNLPQATDCMGVCVYKQITCNLPNESSRHIAQSELDGNKDVNTSAKSVYQLSYPYTCFVIQHSHTYLMMVYH